MIAEATEPLRRENVALRRQLGYVTPQEVYGALDEAADIFVGPRLDKKSADKKTRKAREAARAMFALGRQPFREGLIEWPR